MTPSEYAERYRTLSIHSNGQVRNNVRVEIYRIGKPDPEQSSLWQKVKDHFRKAKQKDPAYKLHLRVNSADEEFSSHTELLRRVVNPYWGKGSPEDCQITLELAVLLGETTIERVQDYANKHIGLDCNGFVGNYIWHVHQGNPWNSWPTDDSVQPGPSMNIASLLDWTKNKGAEIKSVSEMTSNRSYVLAMVNANLKVIPGGPNSPSGHICITEPNKFMPQSFVFNSMGFYDLNMAKKNAYGHPAYWTIESTGPENQVGLRESWYAFRPAKNGKGGDIPGVFDLFRGSKGQSLKFRVAALP
jgi:hypothetical protein